MNYSNENTNLRGPPQYTPQGFAPPPGPYSPHPFPSPQPIPVVQHYNVVVINRRPTCLRFFRALAVAALVWILCGTFFTTLLSRIHYRHHHPYFGPSSSYPVPPHVSLDRCISDDDWANQTTQQSNQGFPFTATTTFELPLSAENLLLISRGPRSGGSLEIVTSPQQGHGVATVEVAVSYFKQDVRDEAKLCYIRRKEGELGVGIFTPELPWKGSPEDMLLFATKVILPEESPESSPLLIKKFETDVPNTVHRIGDLNKKVLFQTLALKGSNAGIDVESVQVETGFIGTSNGPIKGTYNTSSSLALITSNGRVDVDVGLSSINETKPNLSVVTSNAAVASRISLISETGKGGSFQGMAQTSNGRLDVDFPAAPPYSLLTFSGSTSNARAVLSLNPAYEGSFYAQTSLFKPQVKHDKSVTDPTGRNRQRSLSIKAIGKLVAGEVYWKDETEGDKLKPTGSVSVRSSNAQVELNL